MNENKDTTKKMKELVAQLNGWAREYYTLDAPSVSDEQYDAVYDRLKLLEKQTGIVLPDSPTHRVGGAILEKFATHHHLTRLYSLDKAQSFNELKSWYDKIVAVFPDAEFTVEYKYDGLTVNLTYEQSKLMLAATRGNGIVGEDVTIQSKTIKNLPLSINFDKKIEIQGECIMKLSALNLYNQKHPDEPLKNARNAAAGALKNLDCTVTAERNLDIVCYSVGFDGGSGAKTQTQLVEFLHKNGFATNGYFKLVSRYDDIKAAIEEIGEKRESLDFLIDGAVVKVNDFEMRKQLGYTDKFPRWALAFKFKAEEASTMLLSVEWQVGRTGKLTPLGHLDPVELCGATIRRATLNNYDDILRKNLSINSIVFLRRSNDVIPEILGLAEKTENSKNIVPPTVCPVCGTQLIKKGAHLFCPNTYGCPKQIEARLTHFCGKNAFDIEGISEKTVMQLMSVGVTSPVDLFYMDEKKLLSLEGFKEKKVKNLISAVEKSKNIRLENFIFAIGIENVGIVTAREFAKRFKSIEGIKNATLQDLTELQDVGEIVAQSVIDFFDSEYALVLIKGLKDAGVQPSFEVEKSSEGIFSGKKVVLTGTLVSLSRSQASAIIEKLGGQTLSGVTKNTNLVIVGSDAGSKLAKAMSMGIEVWDEQQFLAAIDNSA